MNQQRSQSDQFLKNQQRDVRNLKRQHDQTREQKQRELKDKQKLDYKVFMEDQKSK